MNKALLKKLLWESPRMEPADAVKLVFQNAFGCGHLLATREACARGVSAEAARVSERAEQPAATPIGGGLCRLHLASPLVRSLPPERIADMMLLTAKRVTGDEARFWRGIGSLRALARAGEAPFGPEALEGYLREYGARGIRPVSHSEAYRAAYAPAYRVVLEDLGTLVPVVAEAERRLGARGRALAVLDGPCGAGKTTLAGVLGGLYQARPIHMDDFFLPADMRTPDRLDQPGGNVHYERFQAEVLAGLMTGADFCYRRYDCRSDTMLPRAHRTAPVSVIEGSYAHHPAFREAYGKLHALRVFVHTEADEQLRRLRAREPGTLSIFESRWIPLEKTYLKAYDIRGKADIVLKSHPWA